MEIAQLFVSLGIRGSEKTLNALSYVKTGITDIKTTSLEAKAAILGAVYALEQLTSGAARDGQHIQNLSSFLNISKKSLQEWDYAAQKAGVSTGEFESSLVSIRQKIVDFKANRGNIPAGSGILQQLTDLDLNKPLQVDEIFKDFMQFANDTTHSKEYKTAILKNWGLTDNEVGALFAGKFKLSDLKKAPTLSDSDINQNADLAGTWTDIEAKTKQFVGHLTAEHGKDLTVTLEKVATSFFRIANDIDRIASHMGLFTLIGKLFNIPIFLLDKTANALDESTGQFTPQQKKQFDENNKKIMEQWQQNFNQQGSTTDFFINTFSNVLGGFGEFQKDLFGKSIAPNFTDRFSLPQSNAKTPEVNLTMNFQNDGREILAVKNDLQTAIGQASKMFTANIRTT